MEVVLQNNYTSPEQGDELTKLGFPANSSDCYYDSWSQICVRQQKDLDSDFFTSYPHYKPCWSAGQLLYIINLCSAKNRIDFDLIKNLDCSIIDALVESIKILTDENEFNVMKLS